MSPDQFQKLIAKLTRDPSAAFRTREPDGRELLHYEGATYELDREEPLRFAKVGVKLVTHG